MGCITVRRADDYQSVYAGCFYCSPVLTLPLLLPICQPFTSAGGETDTSEWGELSLSLSQTMGECCLVLFFLVINGKITSVGFPPHLHIVCMCIIHVQKGRKRGLRAPLTEGPGGIRQLPLGKARFDGASPFLRSLLLTRFNLFCISCRTRGRTVELCVSGHCLCG